MFGDDLSTTVSLPEKKGLQNISESSTKIEKKYSYILRSIVAILIWVKKGVSPNIDPDISFLFTRVTKRTNEDKAKLRLVLQYL